MAWKENPYGRDQLIGHADLSFVAQPTLRGSKKRHDPDGTHAQAYVDGLTGKVLNFTVSGAVYNVTFLTDLWQDALDLINTAATADLIASDEEGFLRLLSRHAGTFHYLQINSGSAVDLLGFEKAPVPGSVSYAGEIATAPAGILQSNPEGTALMAHGENILTGSINRAIYGTLLHSERLLKEYEREILSVITVPVTVSTHPISGKSVFYITDPNIRLTLADPSVPNPAPGPSSIAFGVTNPTALQIDPIASIQDLNDSDIFITGAMGSGPVGAGTPGDRVRVDGVFYGTAGTALNNGASFVGWGTPDGKSVFGSAVPAKYKMSAINIAEIRGNVIYIAGPTGFQTANVQPGDTVQIAFNSNVSPFSHAGEFVVDEVFSEIAMSVKAKGDSEAFVLGSLPQKPTRMNPGTSGLGQVFIPVGFFIPATSLVFRLSELLTPGNYKARLLVGKRFRQADIAAMARDIGGNRDRISHALWDHINRTANAHPATAIDYAGGPVWADGSTNPAATVEATFDNTFTSLAGANGTKKIGSAAISQSPQSLLAGTSFDQMIAMLALLNAHELGGAPHHTASMIDYGGSPATRPGWVIPGGLSVEAALDFLVSSSGSSGLSHTTFGVGWLSMLNAWTAAQTYSVPGDTNPIHTVFTAPTTRKEEWKFSAGGSPVYYVRLYVLPNGGGIDITINAQWTGSAWHQENTTGGIGGSAKYHLSNTGIEARFKAAGSADWADTVGGWGNQSFEFKNSLSSFLNSIVGALTLGENMLGTATNAAIQRLTVVRASSGLSNRTLLFNFLDPTTAGQSIRVYRSDFDTEAIEIAVNCYWGFLGAQQWAADAGNSLTCTCIQISRKVLRVNRTAGHPGVLWNDDATGWDGGFPSFAIDFSSFDFASTVPFLNTLTPKNTVKAWALVEFDGFGAVSVVDGFNVASVGVTSSGSGLSRQDYLTVNIAQDLLNENYGVEATLQDESALGNDGAGTSLVAVFPRPHTKAVGSFRLSMKGTNTAGYANLTGAGSLFAGFVMVSVYGAQPAS